MHGSIESVEVYIYPVLYSKYVFYRISDFPSPRSTSPTVLLRSCGRPFKVGDDESEGLSARGPEEDGRGGCAEVILAE